jgi:hypothetical protein
MNSNATDIKNRVLFNRKNEDGLLFGVKEPFLKSLFNESMLS